VFYLNSVMKILFRGGGSFVETKMRMFAKDKLSP
jgi:hypothetical protein